MELCVVVKTKANVDTCLFNRMEIVVEMIFIRVQPKHNNGLSFNQQNWLLLEQSYYEIKCVTIQSIFLSVCLYKCEYVVF